jgi:hypothetical protein
MANHQTSSASSTSLRIEPSGPFDLKRLAEFGFGHRHVKVFDGVDVAEQMGERHIGVLTGEVHAAIRCAGVHDCRLGLDRARFEQQVRDLEEPAFKIDRALRRPEQAEQLDELDGMVVARRVIFQGLAERVEGIGFEPATRLMPNRPFVM